MSYKFNINRQKRICDVLLAIVLLLIYFILGAIKVSPPRHVIKNQYKEIDWTLFKPKAQKNIAKNKTSSSPTSKNNNHAEAENIIIASMDFLENEANNQTNIFKKTYNSSLKVPTSDNESNNELNVIGTDNFAQLPDFNFDNKKSDFLKHNFPGTENIEGPSIEIDDNQHINFDIPGSRLQNNKRLQKIPDEKTILKPEVREIKLRSEKLKKEERDISPIINDLIIWMRKNHTPFSDVVKRFMNFEKGNLTAKVKLNINNKKYDLYLLCKENILEVRICLIEKEKSILLIDSGFKERSNYFREGEVMKSANDSILSFVTRQKTPSQESTNEFYQIFMSWWDTIKRNKKNGANAK